MHMRFSAVGDCRLPGSGVLLILLITISSYAFAEGPRKVALLVGVEDYEKAGFSNLDYAEEDVTELAKLLGKEGFEVTLLLGSRDDRTRATRENIRRVLTEQLLPQLAKSFPVTVDPAGVRFDISLRDDIRHQMWMGNNEKRPPYRLRIERRGNTFQVFLNSDFLEAYSRAWPELKEFSGIRVTLADSSVEFYDLLAGPLPTNKVTTQPYKLTARGSGLADGWELRGKAIDNSFRIASQPDTLQLGDNFDLLLTINPTSDAEYSIALVNRSGGWSLPLHFHHRGAAVDVSLPMNKDSSYYVKSDAVINIGLRRREENFELFINGKSEHSMRHKGFLGFDEMLIDAWDGSVGILSIQVGAGE